MEGQHQAGAEELEARPPRAATCPRGAGRARRRRGWDGGRGRSTYSSAANPLRPRRHRARGFRRGWVGVRRRHAPSPPPRRPERDPLPRPARRRRARRRPRGSPRTARRTRRSRCGRSTSCTTAASRTPPTAPPATSSGTRDLLAVRRDLERDLEQRLRARWDAPGARRRASRRRSSPGWPSRTAPRLAAHVHRDATREQVLELLRLRSVYHLKESDPTAWAVPRLPTAAKAALMELQYDEYGTGDPNRLHAHLFAARDGGQRAGRVVRRLRRRGAGRGPRAEQRDVAVRAAPPAARGGARPPRGVRGDQLAAVAADGAGPERLGLAAGDRRTTTPSTWRRTPCTSSSRCARVCGSLLREEPALEADVWFGAFTCLDLEDRFAVRLLERWQDEPAADERARAGRVMSGPAAFDHPDEIACPGGPLLVRGDHVIEDPDGTHAPHHPPGQRGLPLHQLGVLPWCDGTHKVLPGGARPEVRGRSGAVDPEEHAALGRCAPPRRGGRARAAQSLIRRDLGRRCRAGAPRSRRAAGGGR